MKKINLLLPIATLSGIATIATPLFTLTSCNSKCNITFVNGDHGKIVTDTTIKVKKGTKWSDVQKPYVFADKGYGLDYWTNDGIRIDDGFVINNNLSVTPNYKTIESSEQHTEEVDTTYKYNTSTLLLPKAYLIGQSISLASFKEYPVYNEYTFTIDIAKLSLSKGIKYFYISRINYASYKITNLKTELGVLSCKYNGSDIMSEIEYKEWAGVQNSYITFPQSYTTGNLEITIKVNRPDTKCLPTFELEE